MTTAVDLYKTGLENAIAGWLHEKFTRSQSTRTRDAYGRHLTDFRFFLKADGHDLDSPVGAVSPRLQAWAAQGMRQDILSPASINARIAAVSSFYEYAKRHDLTDINPADRVERKPVQPYRGASTLTPATITEQMSKIDVSTLAGKRDYAILAVTLVTGRRLSEVASLRMDDIHVEGTMESPNTLRVRIVWRRVKGGKSAIDALPVGVAWRLLEYMTALEEESNGAPPQHLWVALARNKYNMTPLGPRGLEGVSEKHLSTSKFHALRHSFAHAMEEAGADVSEIQRRLMHSSLQTTGIYLQALRSEENKHAGKIESMFGIGADKERGV